MTQTGGKIPSSIFLKFFQDATERLNNHPSATTRIKLLRPSTDPNTNDDVDNRNNNNITPLLDSNHRDDYDDEYSVPIPLDQHRNFLIEEQLQALKNCVSSSKNNQTSGVVGDDNGSNNDAIATVTLEDVQSRLRELGSKDLSNVEWSRDDNVKDGLFARMSEMNDGARLAFARSALWAEVEWVDYFKRPYDDNDDDGSSGMQDLREVETQIIRAGRQGRHLRHTEDGLGPMERSAIIEFCGLCSAAVRLPEVLGYLQDGRNIFPPPPSELEGGEKTGYRRADRARRFIPQHWIRSLQHMLIRAVGYDHEFGMMELRRVILSAEQPGNGDGESDPELVTAVVEFSRSLLEAESRATSNCLKEGLSDQHEGGVTRVTSVKLTEKVVNHGGNMFSRSHDEAPSQERMEQHSEEDRRAQQAMIQKAAALQHSILTSLQDMEEEQRNEQLKEAKTVHEEFIKGAMELPPGPERVGFMQNISPEKQKMLLIYKLWGQIQDNPSVDVSK